MKTTGESACRKQEQSLYPSLKTEKDLPRAGKTCPLWGAAAGSDRMCPESSQAWVAPPPAQADDRHIAALPGPQHPCVESSVQSLER